VDSRYTTLGKRAKGKNHSHCHYNTILVRSTNLSG